jgi:hypothetical protein
MFIWQLNLAATSVGSLSAAEVGDDTATLTAATGEYPAGPGDLLFSRPQLATPGPVNLVFNEDLLVVTEGTLSATLTGPTFSAYGVKPNDATLSATLPAPTFNAQGQWAPFTIYEATLQAALPAPTLSAFGGKPNDATLAATLPGLTFAATAEFDSNTERPTVGHTALPHTEAAIVRVGAQTDVDKGVALPTGFETRHTPAIQLPAGVQTSQSVGIGARSGAAAAHTDADRLRGSARTQHTEMLRDRRPAVAAGHDEAIRLRQSAKTDHQERFRDRRPSLRTRQAEGVKLRMSRLTSAGRGAPFVLRRGTRFQEAMRPPAGMWSGITPPLPLDPCYTPSAHLVFADAFGATSQLLFICENHEEPPPPPGLVVVPVRSVYIVLNDVALKRVVGNLNLPASAVSLSIDVDSWTWSFSASLPRSSLADVEPVAGEPTELEAQINGSNYRVLVEQISSDRSFGNESIRVSGRGKSALLAAPYAPIQNFANLSTLTAQQIANEVLTINGVPLGWAVDWQLTDWSVPAGAFSAQGSYIDALNAIVGAAGGYLQPHPTLQSLSALSRYPVAPWEWNTVTPDFVIPSAVMTREGIEWRTNPDYNRVFVSGQQAGILGRVTRGGTAGDLVAPMVTDPLITEIAAARQRGISILGAAGRKADVSLSLPVLTATGVIPPGKWVRYTDGAVERLGIVRATSVTVGGGGANVQQSITLETLA